MFKIHTDLSDLKLLLLNLEHYANQNIERTFILHQISIAWSIGMEVGIIVAQNTDEVIYSCDAQETDVDEYNKQTVYLNNDIANIDDNSKVHLLPQHESRNVIILKNNESSFGSTTNIDNVVNLIHKTENTEYHIDNSNFSIDKTNYSFKNSLNDVQKFDYHSSVDATNNYCGDNSLDIINTNAAIKDQETGEKSEDGEESFIKYSKVVHVESNNGVIDENVDSGNIFPESKEIEEAFDDTTFEEEEYMQKLLAEEFNLKIGETKRRRYNYNGPFICIKCDLRFNCRSVFYKHKKSTHPHDSIATLLGRPRTYNKVYKLTNKDFLKKKKVPTATLR